MNPWSMLRWRLKKKKKRRQTRELREERLKRRRMFERYDVLECCLQELRFNQAIKHTLSQELIDKRKTSYDYVV